MIMKHGLLLTRRNKLPISDNKELRKTTEPRERKWRMKDTRQTNCDVLLFNWFYNRVLDLRLLLFFLFPNLFRHMVGLLGRVISPSQGLYLHRAAQHRKTRTNFHALSGIRTHDPVYEQSRPVPQTARPLDRQLRCIQLTNTVTSLLKY
jgi:hypothetical protein